MLKRILPLLLVACLLLSACGGSAPAATPAPTEAPERLLASGSYAVYDSAGELFGYVNVTARRLIWYDAGGAETERLGYSFDESTGRYIDENDAEFRVTQRHKGLTLRREDGEYTLEPVDALPEPTPEPTPEPILSAEEIYRLAEKRSVEVTAIVSNGYSYMGTGFYDDENGTVITNYHVIEGAQEAYITDCDGKEYAVLGVVAEDAERDIAVLVTACADSSPIEQRAEPAVTGETVYAFGNPLGFNATISDGIVSTAARTIDGLVYIQHTAPISHGNSGGPLLDQHGRVIGVVCAYYQDGQNLNLAIPIGEAAALPRHETISLEELFPRTAAKDAELEDMMEGDWFRVCVATDLGWEVYADLPERLWDLMEINEAYTGISSELEADNYYLSFSADLLEAEGEHLTDEVTEELSQFLTESLQDTVSDAQVTSTRVNIDDTEWLLLVAGSESLDGEGWLYDYLLACETPDGLGIPVVNLMLFALQEEDLDALEDLGFEILASLFLQKTETAEDVALEVLDAIFHSDFERVIFQIHPSLLEEIDMDDLRESMEEGEEELSAALQELEESGYVLSYETGEAQELKAADLAKLQKDYAEYCEVEIDEAVDVPVTVMLRNEEEGDEELEVYTLRIIHADGYWYLEPLYLAETMG